MNQPKCILFDCMETLIDLTELPTLRDYAMWAFDGSDIESLWAGFEDFYEKYLAAREAFSLKLPRHKEYEMYDRLEAAVQLSMPSEDKMAAARISRRLHDTYWKNYSSRCYAKDDVKTVIPRLSACYRLGVVSNFMVSDGIEELLEANGLFQYFDFVVVSINEGWRKPHEYIYDTAIRLAGMAPCEMAFVGDDYENDYATPGRLGFEAVLLDRYGRYPHVAERITDFYGLEKLFMGN